MYPYATQVNGEAGLQAELFYKFKKHSFLGGKYGTMVTLNASQVNDIKREAIDDKTPVGRIGTDGYKTSFLSMTDSLFSRDINITISKKFSKKIRGKISYQHLDFNQYALQGHGMAHDGFVNTQVGILDFTFRLKPKHSLRVEAEALFTKKLEIDDPSNTGSKVSIMQDYGNWAMLILEYSVSPHFFFALSDQFNYVSQDDEIVKKTLSIVHGEEFHRNHYYSVAMGYSKGSSRIQMSYGKQREGILCVGGVCRAVPAAYGFNVSITSTF
jgi:hypothetical protein